MALDVLQIDWVESCPSTQLLARQWVTSRNASDAPWRAFATGHQTEGLGRAGRVWVDTPHAAVLLSVAVVAPTMDRLGDQPTVHLAQLVAGAVAAWLPGAAVGVKPPNDLFVGDRKLGGLLLDVRTTGPNTDWAIVGCGINLTGPNFTADGQEATTVEASGGAAPQVAEAVRLVADTLAAAVVR